MGISLELENENNAEYETVLCSALLHDIGKFYQRLGYKREKHDKLSGVLIEQFDSSFFNPILMNILVQHHHESRYFANSSPRTLTDERERILSYLISRADNFSSNERPSERQYSGKYATMHSIFSNIQIGSDKNPDSKSENYSYKLGRYLQDDMFPDANNTITRNDYINHFTLFCDEFNELFSEPYIGMTDTLLYLIKKYLWCVPSDTTTKIRDISLADHLQTTCAIAACIYKYHQHHGWVENDVKNDELPRFMLLGGDISGIQDYIYGITSIGHGGVARRLRGRSFKISLLTEICADHILNKLNLPLACKIMSAGGQFYLLLPNIPYVIDAIHQLHNEIDEYLLNQYRGTLSMSIVNIELPTKALKQAKFHTVLDDVKLELENKKKQKYRDILSSGTKLFNVEYKGEGLCPSCNINPANVGKSVCDECSEDAELGQKLPNINYLAISKSQDSDSADIRILHHSIKLLKGAPQRKDYLFVWNIRPIKSDNYSDEAYRMLPGQPSGFYPFAGYIPAWREDEKEQLSLYIESLQASTREGEDDDETEQARVGLVKSFQALAYDGRGASRIGVLRADVDNLGLIFSIGMTEFASLSRIMTLSNMLHAFFSGVLLKLIMAKYPNIYVAYAGGDDLMIVGPWEKTIEFSADLRDEFKRYTTTNPTFTLSAGIGVFSHHTPVAFTAPSVGEILENAKDAGRNRLSVFDTVIEWSKYKEFHDWAKLLTDELLNEDSKMSSGFLYRLLGYQRKALKWYEENDNKALLYRPHMAYDIGRNYTDSKGNSLINQKLYNKLISLLGSETEHIWRILVAPINWAALAIRGRRNTK